MKNVERFCLKIFRERLNIRKADTRAKLETTVRASFFTSEAAAANAL